MTPVAQAAVATEILSTLVQGGSFFKAIPKTQKRVQPEMVTVSSIQPVGDLLHVFSHIKKTYRVQWVVLEGGANPPAILEGVSHEQRPLKEIKKGAVRDNIMDIPSDPMAALWVSLDKVPETKYVCAVMCPRNSLHS